MSVSSSTATIKTDAIGVAVAALATALAAAAIIGTTLLSGVASPQQQAAELQRIKSEAAALDREVDSARKHLTALTTQSEHAVHLFPPNHINQRLAEITTLASESHITIATMTPAQPTPAPDAKSIMVGIKLTGTSSYPDLTKFLHTLHDRFRDTAFNALNMAAPPISAPASADPKSAIPNPKSAIADNAPKATFTADLTWYCTAPGSAVSAASADTPAKP